MCQSVAETWRRVWGDGTNSFRGPRFLNDIFSPEKILMTFFSHRPGFPIFPFFSQIFHVFTMLNVVYDPFLTRKTSFLLCSYFRALLLKILGGRMHGRTLHLKFWEGPSPQFPLRSPPLVPVIIKS